MEISNASPIENINDYSYCTHLKDLYINQYLNGSSFNYYENLKMNYVFLLLIFRQMIYPSKIEER